MNYDNILTCPSCGEPIPIYKGFTTWCHKCHWNLNPYKEDKPLNIFENLYCKLSRRYAHSLFKKLSETKPLKPSFSFSMLLTYLVSVFVHCLTVATIALGITIIVTGWPYVLIVFVGFALLLASYSLIPRPYKFDKKKSCKNRYPELFALINNVAITLNSPPIDDIIVTSEFNAFYYQYGIKQKRVLMIGLPLFSILSDDEKIALIAHELSHGTNKDIQRKYIVTTAMNCLQEWYYFVVPTSIIDHSAGYGALAMIPVNFLLLGLSKIIYGLYYSIQCFSWYDSQKAEYLADYYATVACGSDAMISLLNKLCFQDTLYHTITSQASKASSASLLEEFNKNMLLVPQRELDRIKIAEIDETSRLDRSHPPILYRIDFLKNYYITTKSFTFSKDMSVKINNEIIAAQAKLEEKLLDTYKLNIS